MTEKYLAPEPIGEGERFKREFKQFMTAVGNDDATRAVKTAIFLRIVGKRVNDIYEMMTFADREDSNN